jgi:L-iditol 2-dehydrogenase
MKAAVLVSLRRIEIHERPVPEPGPGEVRLKVGAVGVCGSDVHYFAEGRIGQQIVKYPILLGHEPAGIIDRVGEGVDMQPGTRVAVEPAIPCGQCERCTEGRGNLCPNVRFLGTPPIDGIFDQYHVMPAECCVPIPDSISLAEAALLEPLGVALHAVKLARMEVGESVAVFGAGSIGIVTMLAALLAGADRVFVTDLVPERLALAKRMGATAVMSPQDGDVIEWILDETGGHGVDVAFEAAGVQETFTHTALAPRRGGRALFIGIPPVDEVTMPIHRVRTKELTMQHVRRSNREADRCIGLLASGRLNLKPLATHVFPLEQAPEAMELVEARRDGVLKAIIQPHADLAVA